MDVELKNVMDKLATKIENKFGSQIVGVYNDSDSVSVALASDAVINQNIIDRVESYCSAYSKEAFEKGYVNQAAYHAGYDAFEPRGTHWDELETDEDPDGIALTITLEASNVMETSLQDVAKMFISLIELSLKVCNNMNESTKTINEGTFSEIDNAIQEYIMHVKKFDAPVSVDDCIDFCADVLDMDVDALWELENANGTISDGLSEYFNEGFRQTHRHLIKEAKKVLEKNGYIVK